MEIVDQGIAQSSSDTCRHREEFLSAIDSLGCDAPRFRKLYGNAFVHFSFAPGSQLSARRDAICALVTFMLALPPDYEGPVTCPEDIRGTVLRLVVQRGDLCGPIFDDTSAFAIEEPTCKHICKKLKKRYASSGPLELLAFYRIQPILPASHWLTSLTALLARELPISQFRRVWVFDAPNRTVLFVHPCVI